MKCDRFGQCRRPVASFQQTDDSSLSEWLSDVADQASEMAEVFTFQFKGTDRIGAVGVESGADQHEIRSGGGGRLLQRSFELFEIFLPPRTEGHRHVPRHAAPCARAGLVGGAGPWIERPAVD